MGDDTFIPFPEPSDATDAFGVDREDQDGLYFRDGRVRGDGRTGGRVMKNFLRRILEAICRIVWPFVLNCNGCGRRFADVRVPPCEGYPRGEGYCWECAPLSDLSQRP